MTPENEAHSPNRLVRLRAWGPAFAAVVVVWLGLAGGLSALTSRITDWFVMGDELLYERLALSIAGSGSPIPRVHEQVISNINQLYPLVIATVYRHGLIPHGFHEAHVLNAFVMTSVALPAYLLARRVTRSTWLSWFVAVAAATVPWIVLSSFLLTEVVAYPAFVWALLGMHMSLSRPSPRTDLLAVGGLALAILARTQFYALAGVLPVAVIAVGISTHRLRETLRAHVALAVVYALGFVAALALVATGHALLGTYSTTVSSNPLPPQIAGSAPAHFAIVALAGGLLPALIGGAWLASNLRRSESEERIAFAWLGIIAVIGLTVEAASFNLRFGGGLVRERYLFYITPILLVAMVAGLSAARRPRWSVALPLAVLAIGFWQAPLVAFQKLNVDTPASVLNDWLLNTMRSPNGARAFLVLAAVVLALVYIEGVALLPRATLAIGVCVLLLVALPLETGYTFKRLFAVNGTSGLPLTLDQSGVFDWVDREITKNTDAMMIPYPVLHGDFWANIGFWWDLEFWNRTVTREAAPGSRFSGTPPGTFPKVNLRFDPITGKANFDTDSDVAQAVYDTRFHLESTTVAAERGVLLVKPDRPWHADWLSLGLYPDGWTRPGKVARIRIFGDGTHKQPITRYLTVILSAPSTPARAARITSNAGTWHSTLGENSDQEHVDVCVPPHGYTDVELRVDGASVIYGDQSNTVTFAKPRLAGALVEQIALADELGPRC